LNGECQDNYGYHTHCHQKTAAIKYSLDLCKDLIAGVCLCWGVSYASWLHMVKQFAMYCQAKPSMLHKNKLDAAQGSGNYMHVKQVFPYLKLEK